MPRLSTLEGVPDSVGLPVTRKGTALAVRADVAGWILAATLATAYELEAMPGLHLHPQTFDLLSAIVDNGPRTQGCYRTYLRAEDKW